MAEQANQQEAAATWVHGMQDNLWTECGNMATSQNFVTHCVFCVTCPECLAFQPVLDEQDLHEQETLHDAAMHDVTGTAKQLHGNLWQGASVPMKLAMLLCIAFVVLALWGAAAAAIALLSLI